MNFSKIHIVVGTIGGYAREDASVANVVGAYTSEEVANAVALVTHSKVVEININEIAKGHLETMTAYGMDVDKLKQQLVTNK